MFRYKQEYIEAYTGNSYSTGYLGTGDYQVYRLTVDSAAYYNIKTLKYGTTSADTYLKLYDHDFNLIASDDDGGDEVYSLISSKY